MLNRIYNFFLYVGCISVGTAYAQSNDLLVSDSLPFNPIIRDKFTADPAALVHNDILYLYTGHDEAPKGEARYVMKEWLCYSSTDMMQWKEHPSPLNVKAFAWAKADASASQVIHRNGKFYWYVAVEHGTIAGKAIGGAGLFKLETAKSSSSKK